MLQAGSGASDDSKVHLNDDWVALFLLACGAAAVLGYVINRWLLALVPVLGIPLSRVLLGSCEIGQSGVTDCDAHAIARAFWTFLAVAATLAMLLAVGVRRWRGSAGRRGGPVRGPRPHL